MDIRWGEHPGFNYKHVVPIKNLRSLGFELSDFSAGAGNSYPHHTIFHQRFGEEFVNMKIWHEALAETNIKNKAEDYLNAVAGLPALITSIVQLYAEKTIKSEKYLIDKELKDMLLISRNELKYMCEMSEIGFYNNMKNIQPFEGIEVKLNGHTTTLLGQGHYRFTSLLDYAQSMKRKFKFYNVMQSIDKDYFRANGRKQSASGNVDPFMIYLALLYGRPGMKGNEELVEENTALRERNIELIKIEKKANLDWESLKKKYTLLKLEMLRRRPKQIRVSSPDSIKAPYNNQDPVGLHKIIKD
jgi:hypothetical protein